MSRTNCKRKAATAAPKQKVAVNKDFALFQKKLSKMTQDEILDLIPQEVKQDFLSIGFGKWRDMYLPILQLGPFDVGEGDMKHAWMNMLHKSLLLSGCKEKSFNWRLVFWYGTKNMKKAFSFIPKSQIVSYQEGYERGYHELPPSVYEKKCKDENSLTCRERELVDGLIQMEQELRTDRKERAFDPSSCSSKNNHKNMKKNANAKVKVKRTIKREDQKMENQKRKKCKPNAIKVEKKSGMNYEGNVREQALKKSLSTKSESCVSPDNIAKVTRITPSALAQLQERVLCKLGDMRKCVDDKALAFICRVVGNYGEDGGGSSCCHDLQVVNVIKCAIEKQQSLEEEFGPCRYNMSPCFIDMPHVTDILREKKYLNPRLSSFDILTAELRQLLCIAMALTQVSPEWESIQLPNLWRYYRKAFPNLKKSFSEKFDMIRTLCELRLIARRDATCVYVLVNLEDVEICMRRFLVEEDTVYGGMVKYVQTHDRHQRSRKVKKV